MEISQDYNKIFEYYEDPPKRPKPFLRSSEE
jgi:hypothetical protein